MQTKLLIDRFKHLISIAEELKTSGLNTLKFTQWHEEAIGLIKMTFPNDNPRLLRFSNMSFAYKGIRVNGEPSDNSPYVRRDLEKSIGLFNAWIMELELLGSFIQDTGKSKHISHTCFIVHGHNNEIKLEVKEFLTEEMEVKPIVLHQKPNEGKTVLEKFEKHTDVDFAVCIWSADDIGNAKGASQSRPRARQNVVIETGFFWGKLGRDRVIVLLEDGVEIPSDYAGMLYIKYSGNWMEELRREVSNIYTTMAQG